MNNPATPRTQQPNAIRPEQTVGELVIRHPHLKAALEQLGLDYCCGGKRPLAEAVRAAGLDLPTVLAALESATATPPAQLETDWAAAPLTELADHILDTHHVFTKAQISRIHALLSRVQMAHAAAHGAMLTELRGLFDTLSAEIENHLMKEEAILFPAIKDIDGYLSGRNGRPEIHCGSIANPIRQMEHEHDGAGDLLAAMRRLTDGYRLPADGCETFKSLYEALAALETDLHQHIHLENNILFPASMKQEQQMRGEA